MEYPNYGAYKIEKQLDQGISNRIISDSEIVYKFIIEKFRIDKSNIIVSGRSIGSGPAFHLASIFDIRCLILISPIKSVSNIARKIAGRLADLLVDERFDNLNAANKVKCPTAIIHGLEDTMVSHEDSIDLVAKGLSNSNAHLFLR